MIALIDMDLVCYRTAAGAENDPVEIAISRMEELFYRILNIVKATEYKAFLSSNTSFRKKLYPEYKANRTSPKPAHLLALQEYSQKELKAEIAFEGLEADDMLAMHQNKETIICSLDKDMLQVEGEHFQWAIQGGTLAKRWEKPDTFITQTKLGGLRHFYTQCLTGDSNDNIKGVAGIGKTKAPKMLEFCEIEQEMFDVVREAYGNDDEFLMNASCLWLLRGITDKYENRFKEMINGSNWN